MPKRKKNNKVLVSFSGGLDSTVLLADLMNEGFDVYPLCFDEGGSFFQVKERPCIDAICTHYNIAHKLITVRFPNTDAMMMENEFIPGYKMLMQTAIMAHCTLLGSNSLYFGYNQDNRVKQMYADETDEVLQGITDLYNKIYGTKINIYSPYTKLTKAQIISRGSDLEVPFYMTSSCDRPHAVGTIHCGECKWCEARKDAFAEAVVPDPTFYLRQSCVNSKSESYL